MSYLDRQFRLAARIDGFAIQLFPRKKKKEEKPPEEEKPKEEKPKEEKPKEEKPKKVFNFTKDELLDIVKKAIKGLGKFGKLTVRKFVFHYTAGGEDPYDTAMEFNFMNSALSALAPLCAYPGRARSRRGGYRRRRRSDPAAQTPEKRGKACRADGRRRTRDGRTNTRYRSSECAA